jgi:DNA-binding ferritin-like protein
MQKIPRPTVFSDNKPNTTSIKKEGSLETQTSACVSELMNAATSFHKLHLKITGIGSYAAHKALNRIYDALPGHADDLAEGFQGASEKLLEYSDSAPRVLNSISDAVAYLRELTNMINGLQSNMPYSQIVNDLDNVKSTIDGVKYKLLFLK